MASRPDLRRPSWLASGRMSSCRIAKVLKQHSGYIQAKRTKRKSWRRPRKTRPLIRFLGIPSMLHTVNSDSSPQDSHRYRSTPRSGQLPSGGKPTSRR